ncbi:MAG: peptide-methionine (S)-S-oxide reductase MsrA [Pseudomonadota bacterium]
MFPFSKQRMISATSALPDRPTPIRIDRLHVVLGTDLNDPFPSDCDVIDVGMGCFWGAERRFWQQPGVHVTAVGYAGGFTANPSYRDVCSGSTGHTEVVRVVFDPAQLPLTSLLKVFWEAHDPTQGMRQGNDVGTQYRSAIYCQDNAQWETVRASCAAYEAALRGSGIHAAITTEIGLAGPFYYAEDEHQQYLAKNPGGYCGLRGTGVSCAIPAPVESGA